MIAYISAEQELASLVSLIRETYPDQHIFVLEGDLGAGKTTFVQYFCEAQEVREAVSSPTFSLVNEYRNEDQKSLFHFDLYRINQVDELYDMGFEEYLDKADFMFIEWADLALPFLDSYLHIKIEQLSDQQRKFSIRQEQ